MSDTRAADLSRSLADAERRIADLAAELAELEASTAEGPDDEHDPEGATIGFERARVGGLLVAARAEAARLRDAADRVAGGTYGRCVGCGGAIPAERLAALPATDRCVGCGGVIPAQRLAALPATDRCVSCAAGRAAGPRQHLR